MVAMEYTEANQNPSLHQTSAAAGATKFEIVWDIGQSASQVEGVFEGDEIISMNGEPPSSLGHSLLSQMCV